MRNWILGSDIRLEVQILDYRFRYGTGGSDTELQVQILDNGFRFWTIDSDFGL